MDILLTGLTIINNRIINGGGRRDLFEIGEHESDADVWTLLDHQKSTNERMDRMNERVEQMNERVEHMSERLEAQTKALHEMMAQILTKMDKEKHDY